MKKLLLNILFIPALLTLPGPASAHHSFAAEFSRDLPVELEGTVTRVEWTNPHARVYIDVVDENGETANWNLELSTPNIYLRQGWTRKTLQVGDKVTVTGWRARNDPHVANVASLVKEDGTKLFTPQ